jgi:hypothetical protein
MIIPVWECMCGDVLDEDGDCPRCNLEYDECSRCDAVLDEFGRCWYCDSDFVWREP